MKVTTSQPRSVEALGRLRSIPSGFERSRTGAEILAAVERGLERDPKTVPVPERSRTRGGGAALVELLKVLLKAVAEAERVAPKIIATVDDLEGIAEEGATADVAAMRGWRRRLFGDKAMALKEGRLGLSARDGRVVVQELAHPTPAPEQA